MTVVVYLGTPATGGHQVRPALAGLTEWLHEHGIERLLDDPRLLGDWGPDDADGMRPDAPARVAAALGGAPARLVLPVRRQDRLMERAHLTMVRDGGSVPFAEQFPYARRAALDWADLAERLGAVPGVHRLDLLPLDLGEDPLLQVASALGLPAPPLPSFPPDATYTARGIRVARALNPHLVDDRERCLVSDFVLAHFRGPSGADQFLSAATRARVVEAYAEANRRLFRDWLPGYPDTAWDEP